MIDAYRWERLITSSLPNLDIYKFEFGYLSYRGVNSNIILKFQQFPTHFWQEQHHGFTEFAISEDSASIYKLPCLSDTYRSPSNSERYCSNLRNNANTIINVTHLTLCQETLRQNCEYYYPNVTSLTLAPKNFEYLTLEHIKYLKMIFNLCHLKHLSISDYIRTPISSAVLSEIIKETPQLVSLSIHWNRFASFLNDSELCKYLNKIIKTLHIDDNDYGLVDESFEVEQFCETFSNIEHLRCKHGHGNKLLFLLNRLQKLSTFSIDWLTRDNLKEYLSRFENELRKLNVIYDINTECMNTNYYSDHHDDDDDYSEIDNSNTSFYIDILMWFGTNIS